MDSGQVNQSLPAKLIRPDARGFIVRERLFQRIDAAWEAMCRIIWVVAPPGYGKTTLVSSYVENRELDALWMQMDVEDTDPGTFFNALARASEAIAATKPPQLPGAGATHSGDWSARIRGFTESLCARLIRPTVIVLDNYQKIPPDADLHHLLRVASARLPSHIRLIVISRVDPPEVFARLNLYAESCRLGAEDLCLTLAETGELLRLSLKPDGPCTLIPNVLTKLYTHSRGWAVGAALLLRAPSSESGLDSPIAINLDRQSLFGYLSAEIFETLPGAQQDFLLSISLFPRLTGAMAVKLTGESKAENWLEHLRRDHCLMMIRDNNATIYEFHPLVKEFLRGRMTREFAPDRLRFMQIAAAGLLYEAGEVESALELYHLVQADTEMANILCREAPSMLDQGRHQALSGWIVTITKENSELHPWLNYWHAQAQFPFDLPAARDSLEIAWHQAFSCEDVTLLYSCIAAVTDSYFQDGSGCVWPETWLMRFIQLRELSPQWPSLKIELQTLSILGALAIHQPHYEALPELADRALQLFVGAVGEDFDRLKLGVGLQTYCYLTGRVAEGEIVASQVGSLLDVTESSVKVGQASLWLGLIRTLRGQFEAAQQTVSAVHERCDPAEIDGLLPALRAVEMLADTRGGKPMKSLDNTPGYLREPGFRESPVMTAFLHAAESMSAWLDGDWLKSTVYARTCMAEGKIGRFCFATGLGHLLLAGSLWRMNSASGNDNEVENRLADARAIAGETGSCTLLYACDQLQAIMAFERGDEDRGFAALRSMLAITRVTGGLIWPVWGWDALAGLYSRALEAGLAFAHVRRWIRELRLQPPDSVLAAWPWPIEFQTLGRFSITVEDSELKGHGKVQHKQLEMLKALVAFGGQEVSIEKLCDTLWPDDEGGQARTTFDTTLHRVRRLLGVKDALIVRDGKISLNTACCRVDTWQFEKERTALEKLLVAPFDSEALSKGIRQLCSIYQGDFLMSEPESDWLLSVRVQLRRRFVRVVTQIGRAYQAAGEWINATHCYELALEQDPRSEELYCRVMECQAAQGYLADAHATCQRCLDELSINESAGPVCKTQILLKKLIGNL